MNGGAAGRRRSPLFEALGLPAAPARTHAFNLPVRVARRHTRCGCCLMPASRPALLQIPAATEAQQTGYNIKRNEFEPEWDFEAETLISELADFL